MKVGFKGNAGTVLASNAQHPRASLTRGGWQRTISFFFLSIRHTWSLKFSSNHNLHLSCFWSFVVFFLWLFFSGFFLVAYLVACFFVASFFLRVSLPPHSTQVEPCQYDPQLTQGKPAIVLMRHPNVGKLQCSAFCYWV